MEPGRRSSTGCAPDATWARARTGWWGSTGRWCAPISTPRVPATIRPGTSRNRCSPRRWRAGQCATPPAGRPPRTRARTRGAGSNDKNPPSTAPKPADREAIGRSRGGLTTKIHLLADARCRPLARVVTAGQRHDSIAFEPLMRRLRIRRLGRGRPRTRPGRMLADKAYSNRSIRSHLRRRHIKADIPEKADQRRTRTAKGSAGGRPPRFDPRSTSSATRSSGRSTSSRPSGRSPCAPTSVPSSIRARSTWPRSRSGSATPSNKIQ
jgi:hypothetical protein